MSCRGCIHRKIKVIPIENGISGSVEWCTLWNDEAIKRCGYYETWWDRLMNFFHRK